MIIYRTTNLLNNKVYIGQDCKNKPNYLGGGTAINRSIKKYGRENFKKEIICYCESQEDMNAKEIYWIAFHRSILGIENCYNIDAGGKGHRNRPGRTKGKKNKPRTAEHIANNVAARKINYEKRLLETGSKITEENKLSLIISRSYIKGCKKKPRTAEHIANNMASRAANRLKRLQEKIIEETNELV